MSTTGVRSGIERERWLSGDSDASTTRPIDRNAQLAVMVDANRDASNLTGDYVVRSRGLTTLTRTSPYYLTRS